MAKKNSYKSTQIFSSEFNKGMIFGIFIALVLVFAVGYIVNNSVSQTISSALLGN